MAKLTKKDLHPMILKRAQILTGKSDVAVGAIQSLIEEESGYVSRELLGTFRVAISVMAKFRMF